MKSVSELGDLRGKRVLVRSDLNVPLESGAARQPRDHRRRPHPCVRPDDPGPAPRRAHASSCAPTSGGPRATPEGRYSLAPGRGTTRRAAGPRRRLRHRHVGESARAQRSTRPGDGDVVLLENLRFDAAETSKDDDERAGVRRPARRARRRLRLRRRSASSTASRPASTTSPACCPRPSVASSRPRSGCSVASPRTPSARTPWCSAVRRSPTSSASSTTCSRPPTACSSAAGWSSPSSRPRTTRSATRCSRPTSSTSCAATSEQAKERGVEIVLPVDIVVATEFSADAEREVVPAGAIPADRMGLDIGPESGVLFAGKLKDCKTVFWNGPMGVFEMAAVRRGHRCGRCRRWSSSPRRAPSPSSVVVTRLPPCASSASRTRSSATSRPVVARAWSTSRARAARPDGPRRARRLTHPTSKDDTSWQPRPPAARPSWRATGR